VSLATLGLLTLVAALFAYDVVSNRGMRRDLWLQGLVFAAGAVFIAMPEWSTRIANRVGIGRGADLILYLATIWLTRESLQARREAQSTRLRLEELTRAFARASAQTTASGRAQKEAGGGPPDLDPSAHE
jgi:small membrane protein